MATSNPNKPLEDSFFAHMERYFGLDNLSFNQLVNFKLVFYSGAFAASGIIRHGRSDVLMQEIAEFDKQFKQAQEAEEATEVETMLRDDGKPPPACIIQQDGTSNDEPDPRWEYAQIPYPGGKTMYMPLNRRD